MRNTLWQNKKTGAIYQVMGEATCATNQFEGQALVVYRPVMGAHLYSRDKSEFFEKFERVD